VPLFPVFYVFYTAAVAETNRAPFDLAEAESELVSGFMTEHSSVIFVFFFLAEYASLVLICILTTILFLGGYIFISFKSIMYYPNLFLNDILIPKDGYFFNLYSDLALLSERLDLISTIENIDNVLQDPSYEKLLSGLIIGFKTCILIYTFILVRVSYPRVRFDQLMSYC
jgi:NADH-ubiquinone oxidoreductase chain 1